MDRNTLKEMMSAATERFGMEALRHTGTVGMTVAIADAEGILAEFPLGLLDAERSTPMRADATFPVGSIGKLLTTTAAMRAVEAGAVTLDAPVDRYLGYSVRHPSSPDEPVTLRRLLTHTSGLHVDAHSVRTGNARQSTGEYLRELIERGVSHEYGGIPLWGKVGSDYQYSSIGFQLAAETVGCALGRPIGDVIREDICHPLEMNSTYVGPLELAPTDIRRARATGHIQLGQDLVIPCPDVASPLPESTGVLSTASDLARWGVMALRGGAAPGGGAVLSPESLALMCDPLFEAAFPGEVPLRVGTGVQIYSGSFGHIGSYPYGWSGQLRVYPELGLVIAALINSSDLLRYVLPSDRSAWGLVSDHLAGIVSGRAITGSPFEAEHVAELFGMLVADRYHLVGAEIDPGIARKMAVRARTGGGDGRLSTLEIERFVRGVDKGGKAGPTAAGIAAMLGGPAAPVHPDVAALLALKFGASRARWPSPHPQWAGQQGQA